MKTKHMKLWCAEHKRNETESQHYKSKRKFKVTPAPYGFPEVWLVKEFAQERGISLQKALSIIRKAQKKRYKKNPPSICEYCRLIDSKYRSASTPKDRRHALARFRLHRRQLHKNPISKRMRYNLKMAQGVAKRLYHHFKGRGVPEFIMKRIPDGYRGIVEDILKYNGVRVTA